MKQTEKKYCLGCRDDFYNGKNPHGIKECWLFENAKLIRRRRVYMHERPPWKRKPEKLPDCYRQKGCVFVEPTIER